MGVNNWEIVLLMYMDMLEEKGFSLEQTRDDLPVCWEIERYQYSGGDGHGCGYGHVNGDGYGNSYGYGNGYGDGYGYGYGDGDGDGVTL